MIPEKYRIKRTEDDVIEPEQTLIDSTSEHQTIEVPVGRSVFGSFYVFIAILLFVLVGKSFQMQIIEGKEYASLADKNSTNRYPLSSIRGIIYDSDGRALVSNVPVFDLVAMHSQLPKLDTEIDSEIEKLAPVISLNIDELRNIFKSNENKAVFTIKRDISKQETAEVKSLNLAGIYAVANSQRYYPDGAATSHLLGYTSMVTDKDMGEDFYYVATDKIGKMGLEAQYEDVLRGEHRAFDPKSGDVLQADSEPGQDLVLNINEDVQKSLYRALTSVFNSAGVRRGAAIVQNPNTGAVLGIVSMPTFDDNVFENSSDPANSAKISQLLNSKDKPLLDRAVSGRYSPGSTIKPLLALAGLKEGVVTPSTIVNATGSIKVQSEVDPSVYYTFRDWKVHGWTDLKKAIADSVDVYFYALGGGYGDISGLGIDRIVSYLRTFGADKLTGIDLPGELAGFVPSKEWKKEIRNDSWYIGDTYNISIGQGDLIVSPIWLSTYLGSIANGGKLMRPFVVKEIKNQSGGAAQEFSPQVLGEIPFDQATINLVKQGMRQTVLSGTATMLQDVPVPLAAKTGTAQVTGRGLNSLFTVFGPYDNPEVTVTVLVEDITQSQGLAIRVANEFLLWYFGEFKKSR